MSIEYYQGGIEVELTSHNGPIVSRTMPQDFEYRGGDNGAAARRNDTMHQPRRSYDGNMPTAIPVKRLMSFGGLDSGDMVGDNNNTNKNDTNVDNKGAVSAVWDAPPSGIEKENESSRFLRSYEKRPEHTHTASYRSLKRREDMDDNRSTYSHSELDDDNASDISSSAMGSMRRRNRISQIHAERLLRRKEKDVLEKSKKPLRAKTSINEVQPTSISNLKVDPKNVSFGGGGNIPEASKPMSMESKLWKVTPKETALFTSTDSSSASASTEDKSNGPLAPTAAKRSFGEGNKFKFDDPSSNNSVITSSVANSPDRSVATNWTNLTYSTAGSGRVYRTQISCTCKYKGRVMDKVVKLNPDDLQIGRILEGLENGFVEHEDFASALINALFDYDIKKEPLHGLKEWDIANATLLRLEETEKETDKAKELNTTTTSETTTETTGSDEPAPPVPEEDADILSPPATKRITAPVFDNNNNSFGKPPLSPKEAGYARFAAEKTASLQYKDVFGMASAKGIIHFYEDRDEIWIEDYNFCFASRRFKFLSD
ncbi:unnamed protein product [Cylindrotheca closterium]|uniref:Uncharacterized protein n=1 Tax=Cylindrotheca closterium TaxID=2856 RepID=A0AAD2PW51_9STRA|nr:unnamed protein product [Cylindrotheca closterium]